MLLYCLLFTSSLAAGLEKRESLKEQESVTLNDRTEYSINNFDTEFDENYWMQEISENSDPDLSNVIHSIVSDPIFEGTGAMQLNYSVHNIESWGGYAKLYHMHPDIDNGGVYDWSDYNTLSITFFNQLSPEQNGVIEFRLNLSDYADIDDPSYNGQVIN